MTPSAQIINDIIQFNSLLKNIVAKYDIQKAEEKQKKLEQYNKLKLELGL
jgi:hypothetical protein